MPLLKFKNENNYYDNDDLLEFHAFVKSVSFWHFDEIFSSEGKITFKNRIFCRLTFYDFLV